MIDWLLVNRTIAQIGFYLTTISQLTLIYLTLFYVRKDLGAYKRLIILFSSMGIAFANIEFVVYPILHNYNAGFIFFTTSHPLNASNSILTVLLAAYCGLYSFTISLLAVQFIYRYTAVFNASNLKFFNGWYFLLSVLYASWFGLQWAIGMYKLVEVDEYSQEYMRQVLADEYHVDISQVPCLIFVAYQSIPNSTDAFIRWRNVMYTLDLSFIVIGQYGVMIYCGSRLYYEMEEKMSMLSAQAKKLHRQIFKTLLLQIATPTIVLFSPIVFTVITVPYFDLEISMHTGAIISGFTLYPALDAFILMYVITDYRKAFKYVLRVSRTKTPATIELG